MKVVNDGCFIAVISEKEDQSGAAATEFKSTIRWKLANDLSRSDNIYHRLKRTPSNTENVIRRQWLVNNNANANTLKG